MNKKGKGRGRRPRKGCSSWNERTQAQIKKLHNNPYWLLSNESISIDKLVSFENQLDDSWE